MAVHLDTAIADAEAQLDDLDAQRDVVARRLAELIRLRGLQRHEPREREDLSPAAKLRLFRDLFVGREDVFAVRWDPSPCGVCAAVRE